MENLYSRGADMCNILDLVPKDKFDNSTIEIIKVIDVDEVEPILYRLLEWLQDINWPIAQELFNILPRFHTQLVPHIRAVLNSDDDIWKNWILCLIKEFPTETVVLLSSDIKRIAKHPTANETLKETNIFAIEVIEMFEL